MTLHTRIQHSARWLAALGLLLASMGIAVLSTATSANADPGGTLKSYVCKFKTTPGAGEQLQSGQNPIWVANSSLGVNGPVEVGQAFADGQGRSLVIVANTPQLTPEPSTDLCFATADISYTEPTCANQNTVDFAVTGQHLADPTYTGDKAAGGTITVTAHAEGNFRFAGGSDTLVFDAHTFNDPVDLNGPPCVAPREVTPLAPTFTDPACGVAAAYTLPDGPDGVTYEVDGDAIANGLITVTALVHAPFVLAGGAQTVFQHTFGDNPDGCGQQQGPDSVTPAAPSFTDPTCANGNQASFVVPTVAGVQYVASGEAKPGAAIQVTATAANADVSIDTTAPSSWSHAFAAAETDCAKATPTSNTVIPALVHAGLGDQLADTRGQTGLALLATGMLVLLVSGGLGLTRRRGSIG